MTNSPNPSRKKTAGRVLATAGFLMILANALDYLFGEGQYAGSECASLLLVLLDLNLPVLDGYQVLERMKADERTKRTPVVVLTTTDDTREVSRCYDLGCNVYVSKPVDYKQFSEAICNLGLFLSVVTIPGGEG